MKVNITLASIVSVTIFLGCSPQDSTTGFTDSEEVNITTMKSSARSIENTIIDPIVVSREQCCNNLYPSGDDPSGSMRIAWCPGYKDSILISINCGYLWSNLVNYGDRLYYKACDERPYYTNPVEWMTGTTSSYHPSLTWDFIYSHGYRIKRKIGSLGLWSTVMTTGNNADTTWIDDGIDVRTIEDPVYYKVYSKVYSDYANTAPQKVYCPSK